MEIINVEFVISNMDVKKCLVGIFFEYVFIGWFNVGKFSFINMLIGWKGLVMIFVIFGKIMFINYFLINNSWYLVDLFGYGYVRWG